MTASPQAIRIGFLLLILVLPVELTVKTLARAEPYPGLFLPSFARVFENNSIVTFDDSQVVGVLRDGTELILDKRKVMPGAGGGNTVVFENIFSNQKKVASDDSITWLQARLAAAYPDLEFTSLFVRSRSWAYDSANGANWIASTKGSYRVVIDGEH
jgi:hypothetical protein